MYEAEFVICDYTIDAVLRSGKGYYSDWSVKGGVQKVKLAYTILAPSIADQYGLELDETCSVRQDV